MNTTPARFLQTCVDTPSEEVDDLHALIDGADTISRRTFLKYVDRDDLRKLETDLGYGRGGRLGLSMARDWHVSYHRGTWQGRTAFFFCWSAIEHIFI